MTREEAIEAAAEPVRLEDLRKTEFEAIQFTGTVESLEAIKAWAGGAVASWSGMPKKNKIDRLHIRDATFNTRPGDWVVKKTELAREKFTSVEAQDFSRWFRVAHDPESALLDRIEEEIGKLVHEPNRDENGDQSYGYGLGLNAALAVLSQIRQEGKP